MSHVPLLAKQNVPKLQPPRRGPQVVCLCLLLGIVLLLVPSSAYATVLGNATHATHAPPDEPPPEAVRRIMEFAKQQPYVHRFVGEDTQQDLVTAVGYLATRELQPR